MRDVRTFGHKTITVAGVAVSDGNNYRIRYADNTTSAVLPLPPTLSPAPMPGMASSAAAGLGAGSKAASAAWK